MTAPSTTGLAWEQRGTTGGSASVGRMKVWYRIASNEPAQWVFGGDGNGNVVVLIISNWDIRGGDFLWDVEPTFNTGTALSQISPSITMDRSTNRLIRAWATETVGGGHTTAGSYTEHEDISSGTNSLSVQSQQTGGPGTTGTVAASAGSSDDYVAV